MKAKLLFSVVRMSATIMAQSRQLAIIKREIMNKFIFPLASMMLCICTLQAQNKNEMLSMKQQQVVAISMYAAQGNQDSLRTALVAGLDAGLTVSEEKEVLLQLYAYCGFPRSMGALTTLMNLLKDRKAQGIEDIPGKQPDAVTSRCQQTLPPCRRSFSLITATRNVVTIPVIKVHDLPVKQH